MSTLCKGVDWSAFPTIRRGNTGDAIKIVQQILNHMNAVNGIDKNAGYADGIFGSGTEAAVKDFQAKQGLSADGIIGSQTWAKLQDGGFSDFRYVLTGDVYAVYNMTIKGFSSNTVTLEFARRRVDYVWFKNVSGTPFRIN